MSGNSSDNSKWFDDLVEITFMRKVEDLKAHVVEGEKKGINFNINGISDKWKMTPVTAAFFSHGSKDKLMLTLDEESYSKHTKDTIDKLNYLCGLGANMTALDGYCESPLVKAVRTHDLELVKKCLEGVENINEFNEEVQAALLETTRDEDTAILDYLLASGAPLKLTNDWSLLHEAVLERANIDMIKKLLSLVPESLNETGKVRFGLGFDLEVIDVNPLSIALFLDRNKFSECPDFREKLDRCQLLIEAGATIQARPLNKMMEVPTKARREFLDEFVRLVAKHGNPKQQDVIREFRAKHSSKPVRAETPMQVAISGPDLALDSGPGPDLTPGDFA